MNPLAVREHFTDDSPAENIFELLDHLRGDHPEAFLYRGQTRHYPALIPSAFRRAMIQGTEDHEVIGISAAAFWAALSDRDRRKFSVMQGLIESNGRAIGNVLAQQYGVSSECIDVTSCVDIAAYFATRNYPAYDHFSGRPDQALGVIYRFPRKNRFVRNLDEATTVSEIETRLGMIGLNLGADGYQWFTSYAKQVDLDSDEHLAARVAQMFSQHGREQLTLLTHPVIVSYQNLECELARPFLPHSLSRLRATRLFRQDGGFIRPPIVWECSVPEQTRLVYLEELDKVAFEPGLALAENLIGVINTNRFPGLETFFFKHSDRKIEHYDRDYLWPAENEDVVFNVLAETVRSGYSDYLSKLNVAVDDRAHGILDRGFYPADVPCTTREDL
jgi:hypothetical protein